MHEERNFLDELREHPEDDVTRLVYADWLEERGDPRGAYLRAEVALARKFEGETGYGEAEAEWTRASEGIDPRWIERSGKRWDVVFLGYPPHGKIGAIRAVRLASRDALGSDLMYHLGEGLVLVECAPTVILVGTIRPVAEALRRKYGEENWFAIIPTRGGGEEYRYHDPMRDLVCTVRRWRPPA